MRSGYAMLCTILLGAAPWGEACAAEARVTLAELERLVDAAPAVRLAEAERAAAQAREELAVAQAGPRLFAGASAAQLRDPGRAEQYLVQTIGPDGGMASATQRLLPQDLRHRSYGAVVGLRLPLFGSRELALRAIDSARSELGQQRYKEALSRLEARGALRHAYIDAWFGARQAQLAQAYLDGEPGALRILQLRGDAHMLLAPERKEIELGFLTARQNALAAGADGGIALRRLAILARRELGAGELAPPALAAGCVTRAAVEGALERHPDIGFHAAQLEHKRRLLALAGASAVEGGISLSHGRVRETGGGGGGGHGYNTAVALEVSVPLGAAGLRRAQRAQAAAEASRAQLALDSRRQDYLLAFERLTGELQVRAARLALARQRLDAARAAWRIAAMRAASLEGDLAVVTLRARFGVYAAASERLEAQAAEAHTRAELLGYGIECGSPDAPPAPAGKTDAEVDAEIAVLLGAGTAGPIAPPDAMAAAPGWYAWDGLRRFAAAPAGFWPASASRILLSLDRGEIAAARAGGPGAARLDQFLQEAKQRGVRVELLLGDPGWALPEAAEDLAGLVRDLTRFAFEGVHLDLERMQLMEAQRAAWPDGIVGAVARLRATTALPLSLSLHPRDAAEPALLRRLHQAGLDEVTFMAYQTDPEAVAARLLPVLRAHPALRFSVAQSIEPSLPDGESHARAAQSRRDAAWRALSERLNAAPNFTGIVIQSLEHHADGVRHEH